MQPFSTGAMTHTGHNGEICLKRTASTAVQPPLLPDWSLEAQSAALFSTTIIRNGVVVLL
jgi:hypothetical protein